MFKIYALKLSFIFFLITAFLGCNDFSDNPTSPNSISSSDNFNDISSILAKKGFVHGIVITIDGMDYYFDGAPDGENGETDIPGHSWVQASPNMLVGKHYNTGPFGASSWWSSDAPDGEYLYKVHAIIDTWSMSKAEAYAKKGYVHYHELVKVSDGTLHPNKVVWLKHIARTSFTLDGGPGAPNPPYEHEVSPGVDYLFPVNGLTPYNP